MIIFITSVEIHCISYMASIKTSWLWWNSDVTINKLDISSSSYKYSTRVIFKQNF